MRRPLLAAVCAAILAVCGVLAAPSVTPAHAANPCWVTAKIPWINNQGHLNTHFSVNCTDNQAWTVDATVQAWVGTGWVRAGNTNAVTVSGHGDATVSAEVETGAWSCTNNRLYQSHAVLRGGNSDNSADVFLCQS